MTTGQSDSEKATFNHELLQRLRHLRNEVAHGSQRPDGEEIARRLQALGVTVPPGDLQWVVADLLRGMSDHGEYFVPPVVIDVARALLEGYTATVAFDPWAGVGVLAAAAHEAAHAKRTIACSPSPNTLALARVLAPQLEWQLGKLTEPLACIETLPEGIDVVVCIPPMGMKAPHPIEVCGPSDPVVKSRDVGQALLVACSLKLSAQGRALFVLPGSFFVSTDSVVRELASLGLGIEAALELPAGSFAPYATVSAYLVVVRRQQVPQMFVAQLSQDANTNRQVLSNLRERTADGAIEMGRMITAEEFRGFGPLRLAERLRQAQQGFGAPAVRLWELALTMTLGRPGDAFVFPSADNCVFIPLLGISDVVRSTDEMTLKPQNYAQLAIDPAQSDARFVARFFNSDLGRAIRDANKAGSTIPKLNSTALHELRVFIPALTVQQRVLDVAAKLSSEVNAVRSLQSELADLDRDLWANPKQFEQVDVRVREFSRKMQSGASIHAAATLEQWFESLPFPLASILRAWQATQSQDNKTKQEHLQHFFEATAEFLSVIYLSAFSSRPELFVEHRQKLGEAWKKQNLSIERATFGTWKTVVEYFAKQTRTLMAGDDESRALCSDLFADATLTMPGMLASRDLAAILSTTNKMRNDSGHGGVVSQAEASLRNQQLVTELQKLRDTMTDLWTRVHLVQALGCQPRRGVFDNEVAVMMGSNSEFLKASRTMSTWLDVERLYLVSKDSSRALALLPLVHVGPSPASAKNACYFFNRVETDGVRFVSYHFADQPERKGQFAETSEAIRFLTDIS